ncbi:MAG: DUF2971 domain-containing protein [bacterium]
MKTKPKTVYRYRNISVNSLHEASTSSFYLAEPKLYNDPFDCNFKWYNDSSDDLKSHLTSLGQVVDESLLSEAIEANSLFQSNLNKEVQNLGISCFTTDPMNKLMWAHYANGHRGICLEYVCEGILASDSFKNVVYDRESTPILASLDLLKDLNKLEDFFDRIVFHKSPEWKYENEWRLMLIRPKERMVYLDSPVASVTFGLKCSLDDVNKTLNILRQNYFSGITKFFKITEKDGEMKRIQFEMSQNRAE